MGTFVPRPPSSGYSKKGAAAPFLVSGAGAGKNWIIFPGGVYGGKNTSHGATCERAPAQGLGPFCTKAKCNASPASPEGHCAIVAPAKAWGHRA